MKRTGKRLGVGISAAAAVGVIGLIAAAPAGAHKVAHDTGLQLKLDTLSETPSSTRAR